MNTFNFQFYVRSSKANKSGYAPLEIAFTVNGKRRFVNLPYKCLPADFNRKRKPKELLDYIAAMRKRVNEILAEMASKGIPVTAKTLGDILKTGGFKTYTLGNLFNDYLTYYKKRVGVDLTHGAYRKFELSKELFFSKSGLTEQDEVTALTNIVVLNYCAELKKVYKNASYASYMAKLKTIVKFAIDNGKLTVNPFSTFKIQRDKPNIEVLSEKEINGIKIGDFGTSLNKVRDCFLFQLYSGLSFIDLEHLRKEDIQENNGVYFIRKNRIKSGVEYTAVLLPGAIELLEKYDYCLPVISNQKTNIYLHQIERVLGLNKSLHSHIARHTYAYLLLNKLGVRAETTARALGHTSPKTTLRFYANISSETTVNEIGAKLGFIG